MFADISHDRQQSLLRQRNLFALTSAGLAAALAVAAGLAATRDREVVLLPTLPKQLTVSSAGVEADYLELVTRDTALVLLNRSPEGLDYWMGEILKLADPASYGRLKAELVRIVEAITNNDRVALFGDYDVDGACSCALMSRYLRHFGLDPQVYIPDRIFEGYGPNIAAIDKLIDAGAHLIITLDCGTVSEAPIAHAREL